jgi:hypothetical protein
MPQPYPYYVDYSPETIRLLNHAEAVMADARDAVATLRETYSHGAEQRAGREDQDRRDGSGIPPACDHRGA